jgi:hypothetical protein
MDSQISHIDMINITRPQSRAPSMVNETPVAHRHRLRVKKQPPQKSINQFWDNFNTKHPGKVFTVLPNNIYAKRAAANAPRGSIPGQNALASYQEAADARIKKVEKIAKESRRLNQKYRDPHFDIEADFKRSQHTPEIPPDCLTALTGDATSFQPMSVKRIEVRHFRKLRRKRPANCFVHSRTFSTDHSSS